MRHLYSTRREHGAALVLSLLLLVVLFVVCSGTLTTTRIETQIASNDTKGKQVLLAAEYALAVGENTVQQAGGESDLAAKLTSLKIEGVHTAIAPWRSTHGEAHRIPNSIRGRPTARGGVAQIAVIFERRHAGIDGAARFGLAQTHVGIAQREPGSVRPSELPGGVKIRARHSEVW